MIFIKVLSSSEHCRRIEGIIDLLYGLSRRALRGDKGQLSVLRLVNWEDSGR